MTVKKQKLIGSFVKKSSDKTIVVKVERRFRHPRYKKVVKVSKNYLVDYNSDKDLTPGEKVVIISCRPVSKLKRWRFHSSMNVEVKS